MNITKATQTICCMAGKNSHIGLQNSHASHYPVNDWGFVSSKHLMKMCQIYMSGIGSKALEIQVKATEAKRLVPVVCRTMTLQPTRRSRETPGSHCSFEGLSWR